MTESINHSSKYRLSPYIFSNIKLDTNWKQWHKETVNFYTKLLLRHMATDKDLWTLPYAVPSTGHNLRCVATVYLYRGILVLIKSPFGELVKISKKKI